MSVHHRFGIRSSDLLLQVGHFLLIRSNDYEPQTPHQNVQILRYNDNPNFNFALPVIPLGGKSVDKFDHFPPSLTSFEPIEVFNKGRSEAMLV